MSSLAPTPDFAPGVRPQESPFSGHPGTLHTTRRRNALELCAACQGAPKRARQRGARPWSTLHPSGSVKLSHAIGHGCAAKAWTHRSTATALNVSPGAARLVHSGSWSASTAAQPSRTGAQPGQLCWRSQAARRSAEHVAAASSVAGLGCER